MLAAAGGTLKVMNRAVDFADLLRREAGFLEMAVDVAGEGPDAVRHVFGQRAEQAESGVRRGLSVERQAMAVEAPGEARVGFKGGRVGDRLEGDSGPAEGGIDGPEAARPAKVGQTGVDAHAGAGGDQQAVGLIQPFGRLGDVPGALRVTHGDFSGMLRSTGKKAEI